MTNHNDLDESREIKHQVSIGHVGGNIRNTIIAGRDVNEVVIDQLVYNIFEDDTALKEQRDRQDALLLMRKVWITNVLDPLRSLAPATTPAFELCPDMVEDPWAHIVDTSDKVRQLLPPETTLLDVFDEAEGSLLILGEPRVGKTTLLLDLAQQAIAWAEEGPEQPLPVVLPLGWWLEQRQLLVDWLVTTLNRRYFMREDTVRTWLDNGELFLLLDGLDQVQPDRQRTACVEAINTFYQEHGLTQIVVCCRTAAYEALQTRLQLQAAVCVSVSG